MFRTTVKFLCIIVLSASVISVAFARGEKLRYQMAKGVTHEYTVTSDTKSKSQMMGQEFSASSWTFFGISMTGEDVGKNGELIFVAKVDTNLTKIDSPMLKDTNRVLKEFNGKRVRLTLSPLGKTLKSVPIDSVTLSPQMQMMGGTRPAEFLRRVLLELPEKEVGVGDTWKKTNPDTTIAQGMKIVTKPNIQFKIAGNEKVGGYDCVKITFDGTSSQYGTGSRQGMEMVIDGNVKTKGTAYFAPAEGLLLSIDQTSTTEMNISGTGEQMFTGTQSITQSSKVKLVK
jgi:hypothetical protein